MTQSYFLLGSPEPMERERWAWTAIYSDGTYLCQFDDQTMQFHQFGEIDQSKLTGFVMSTPGKPPFIMHWTPDKKLIHFYRNTRLNADTPDEVFIKMYCFGYETATDKVMIVIMPDDQMRMVRDPSEIPIC